jgi:hypothetical protein
MKILVLAIVFLVIVVALGVLFYYGKFKVMNLTHKEKSGS